MDKVFRSYYLVYKTDVGLCMEFFDTLEDLYNLVLNVSSIISYSVFRTLEIKNNF